MLGRGAARGVDENEVAEYQGSKDEVEVDGVGIDVREKDRESCGCKNDSVEEEGPVAMVEVVAGFEVAEEMRLGVEGAGVHEAGVHQTIGGVERPDGEGHGELRDEWEMNLIGGCDEPGPEGGDGWGVEREKVPAGEWVARWDGGSGVRPGWSCGEHWIPV